MAFFGEGMPRDPEGHGYVQNGGQLKGIGRLVGRGGTGENGRAENMKSSTYLITGSTL